jgi:hypothetical protein
VFLFQASIYGYALSVNQVRLGSLDQLLSFCFLGLAIGTTVGFTFAWTLLHVKEAGAALKIISWFFPLTDGFFILVWVLG